MMANFHEMRDPIHGFIKLSDKEMKLINTRVFQHLEAIMIFDEKREVLEFLPEYTGELFFVRPATAAASLETVQVYAPLDLAKKQNLLELETEIQDILRSD